MSIGYSNYLSIAARSGVLVVSPSAAKGGSLLKQLNLQTHLTHLVQGIKPREACTDDHDIPLFHCAILIFCTRINNGNGQTYECKEILANKGEG